MTKSCQFVCQKRTLLLPVEQSVMLLDGVKLKVRHMYVCLCVCWNFYMGEDQFKFKTLRARSFLDGPYIPSKGCLVLGLQLELGAREWILYILKSGIKKLDFFPLENKILKNEGKNLFRTLESHLFIDLVVDSGAKWSHLLLF